MDYTKNEKIDALREWLEAELKIFNIINRNNQLTFEELIQHLQSANPKTICER